MSAQRIQLLAWAIIIVVGGLLYGFTLQFPFVFDDHIYLVDNPLFRDFRSFTFPGHFVEFANKAKSMGLDPDLSTNLILRPVTYLTFYLNFVLGGLRPAGFRIVNIAIHCANAILLFHVVSHLLRNSRRQVVLPAASIHFISASAAILFLVHPLQIESVTYVIQRFTSFATLWYLAVIFAHFASTSTANKTAARIWRWSSVIALILGMLSKEFVFTAPFMLVSLDWLVVGTSLKSATKRAWPHFVCLPLIPILIVLTAWAQRDGNVDFGSALRVADPFAPKEYQYHYALTQPQVILTYLRLIFVPIGLNVDPDFPVSTSILQWRVLVSGLTIATIIAGTIFWCRQRLSDARWSLILCGVIWFFLTLSIDSSVVPLPDLMAEHRSYLPSVGIFIALGCVADLLRERFPVRSQLRNMAIWGVAVWALFLGAATIVRNNVWRSELSLWGNTAANSPNKPRPWINLGGACAESGNLPEAANSFRRVITLQPNHVIAYRNLAKIENDLGRHKEAVAIGLVGLKYTPAPFDYKLYHELAAAYFQLGDLQNSITALRASVTAQPGYRMGHLALGELYRLVKEPELALRHYRAAAAIEPLDPSTKQIVTQLEGATARRADGTP